MRVQFVKLLVAVAAIASTVESKTTTPVARDQLEISEQLNSTVANDESERTGWTSSLTEKVTNLFLSPTQRLEKEYKKLDLHRALDKPFEKPFEKENFPKWLNTVNRLAAKDPRFSESAITLLNKYCRDEELIAKFIQAAKTVSETRGIAEKLEEAQMSYWLAHKKSVHDVFSLLKLSDGNPFINALFSYWTAYIKRLSAAHPDNKLNLAESLEIVYDGNAKVQVKRALQEMQKSLKANTVSQVEQDAMKLNVVQYWLDSKTSVEEVFNLLRLDTAADNVIAHPFFEYWSAFVTKSNAAHPEEKFGLANSLTTLIGDESVSKSVEAALKVKDSSVIKVAKRVQTEQFERWSAMKYLPNDVGTVLKLNHAREFLRDDPVLATYYKFIDYKSGEGLS